MENRGEREVSRLPGLAEKKITFRKTADSAEVLTGLELEEAYPKLKDGGGFELLRSGQFVIDRVLISSPPGGYSVNFLKNCGLGQSTVYIFFCKEKNSSNSKGFSILPQLATA